MTLFVLGAVLWSSCLAVFLIAARLSTVGQSRRSVEVFLFAFPFSGLATLMMVPAVPSIGNDSVFQNMLLIGLLVMWAAFSLLRTNTCQHLLVFVADKPNARPFFSRRPW